jgi:hypothetical protein
MEDYTPDFSVAVQGVKGFCPAGEVYAKRNISEKKIPVLSCEGPCIRGELPDSLLTWSRPKCRRLLGRATQRRFSCLILQWRVGLRMRTTAS